VQRYSLIALFYLAGVFYEPPARSILWALRLGACGAAPPNTGRAEYPPELSVCSSSHVYSFSIDLCWAQGVLGKALEWPCCLDVEKLSPVLPVPKEKMSWDELG